ncbi:diaminobutyrate--2-oxoglutarate transaminase [Herbaspirillum sp. ST 5-3]|uniref:diaminobutyrate--2-oxoglutarate transaminase n=1 Tax=Oxalobacteraceae TaxID=75682 RepID=UPI0010A3CC95|nr:diaminobutyrate--2-oxoglutarate transaminase [Herbaspirillum sp. ST 5-3]
MLTSLRAQNEAANGFQVFEELESSVRSYCRDFPAKFSRAKGSLLHSVDNKTYIDFFAGAGALNYGHNCEPLKKRLQEYLESDGITHSLDFYTQAKEEFITSFEKIILQPRRLRYKLQFTGPTGTNAVEAALKLARKVTKRSNVIAFTNAYHGMSLGALALTTNPKKRQGAGINLTGVTFMPYEGFLGKDLDTIEYVREMLKAGSGIDVPAAFIVETIQGEGGLKYVTQPWLQRLQQLAQEIGALLIIDDIQAGCGRSGRFFSFEDMGVYPDIICLSKSLSGYGLPFSMNLIRPQHDIWESGEHNGTFRGNNLAFVTGKAALEEFWGNADFEDELGRKIFYLHRRLGSLAEVFQQDGQDAEVRGRGFLCGIALSNPKLAADISEEAFHAGLIVETCGVHGHVIKLLPALTIEEELVDQGVDLLEAAIKRVLRRKPYAI